MASAQTGQARPVPEVQISLLDAPEEWRAVAGWPAYEVSNYGHVRRTDNQRTMQQIVLYKGYVAVALSKSGRKENRRVHHLVLEAFIGPRPDGHEADHINSIKVDNRVGNLQWVTPSENQRRAHANGLKLRGEAVPNAKLNEAQVLAIRAERTEKGTALEKLAAQYGVNSGTISHILHRNNWKHI